VAKGSPSTLSTFNHVHRFDQIRKQRVES